MPLNVTESLNQNQRIRNQKTENLCDNYNYDDAMMMMMIDEIPQVIRSESVTVRFKLPGLLSDQICLQDVAWLQEFDYCCVPTSMILHPSIHPLCRSWHPWPLMSGGRGGGSDR